MSLTVTKLSVTIAAVLAKAVALTSNAQVPTNESWNYPLADGVSADEADLIYADERTLAASASEDIDLAGSLTDPFGASMTFARIKAVAILADDGNTNDVQVTRPSSNGVPLFMAAGDGIALKPRAFFAWADPGSTGVGVTASTADLLHIANSGGGTSVTYRIVVIGASS